MYETTNQNQTNHNKNRRYSLPEKLVVEGTSRVIVLENIPEKDDEDVENCGIPKIVVCRSKSDSEDKKCKKVLIRKPAPNGGASAWLIVLASFLAGFCIDGTCYSFGVFFDSFLKTFRSSKGLTALSGALISGVYQTTGPIASALIHKFGCRKVTIVGGLMTAFSLYASAFATNIYFHLLTYGVLSGIGLGLIYLPAIITVSSYFTSRRSLATGISLCGSGLGAFFYAPTCQYLLEHLSLVSSVCILALIIAIVGLFCGLLQSPLEQVISLVFDEQENGEVSSEAGHKPVDDRPDRINEDENEDNSRSEEKLDQVRRNSRRKNNLFVPTDFGLKGRKNGQRTISECVAPNLAILEPNLKHYDSSDANSRSTFLYRSKNSLIFKQQDIFYSGSTLHLQPQSSVLNIAPSKPTNKLNFDDNISNIVTVKKEVQNTVYQTIKRWLGANDKSEPDKPVTEEKQRKMTSVQEDEDESALKIVKEMLDVSLFRDSVPFTLLTFGNFASMVGFYIPFIYLSQHCEQSVHHGDRLVSKSESALLLSFIGITNTFGRLLFGVIADLIKKGAFRNIPVLNHMTVMTLNNYSLFGAGVCIIFIPFSKHYFQIVFICLAFGVCIASAMCLTSIILVDLLGLEKLTNSFALIALVRGIASIVGPPLCGILYDYTGSFDWTFYFAGIMFLISSVLCFLVKVNEPSNCPASTENLKASN